MGMLKAITVPYAMKSATIGNAVKLITDPAFSWGVDDLAAPSKATITARAAGVMYTMDGATDPTANVGHLIAQNATVVIQGTPASIKNLRFLREAAADATLTISLER